MLAHAAPILRCLEIRPGKGDEIAHRGHFKPVELRRIERIVEEHRYVLLERWDADFGV